MATEHGRLTNMVVPAEGRHIFDKVLSELNMADEIHGIHDPMDYVCTMEVIKAEIEARMANAMGLIPKDEA